MTGDARARLAQKMNGRRLQLRRSWAEIARRAGMDESNLRRIRNGKIEISDLAERGLEDALEIKPGSIRAVLGHANAEFAPLDVDRQPSSSRRKLSPIDPRTAPPEELAEMLEQLREHLVEERGEAAGLDEFSARYHELMKIRAGERRKREARASQDRSPSHVPTPKE